jgi:hypothetical protein
MRRLGCFSGIDWFADGGAGYEVLLRIHQKSQDIASEESLSYGVAKAISRRRG